MGASGATFTVGDRRRAETDKTRNVNGTPSSLNLSAFLDAVELPLDILIERQDLVGRKDLPDLFAGFF